VDASALPEQVSVAMGEIAENMHEGLLALAVGAGLQVMAALMEADVTALAGPKGKHDATRTAVRHGRERGSVKLGGRRVPITRPRVRAADGAGELPIVSYELFSSTEILHRHPAQRRCWPACRPAVTRSGLSRSASRLMKQPRRQANPRSRGSSWR
jgi:hypothetical protein